MASKPTSFPLRMTDEVRAAVDEYCLRSLSMNTAINGLLAQALGEICAFHSSLSSGKCFGVLRSSRNAIPAAQSWIRT